MQYRAASAGAKAGAFETLYPVLSLLSYMLKAPLVKPGTDVVNSLNRQRNALEAFLKACIGLEGSSDLLLDALIDFRTEFLVAKRIGLKKEAVRVRVR